MIRRRFAYIVRRGNKGTGVSIDDSFSMIAVHAMHCTTGQFKGQAGPSLSTLDMFSAQHMRATGN